MPTARLDQFLSKTPPPTPFIVLDLDIVRARYAALLRALPAAAIYYAVKANLATEIAAALAALGASFDLANPGELDICLGLGSPVERLSFGNTIKRERDIAAAWSKGVGLFAFDSAAELDKLAGARCARLLPPIGREQGCGMAADAQVRLRVAMAADLLVAAKQRGLHPVGVSSHVGSQQTDPRQWSAAIAHAAWIFHLPRLHASRAGSRIAQP